MNRLNHFNLRAHRGFTLVEIMVALVLGLFLMLGVGKLFVGNTQGYRLQTGMGRLQENARFALDILKRDVGQAGFPRGSFAAPVMGLDGVGSLDSDSITVTYQMATDCLGAAAGANTYSVAVADGVSSLTCNGTPLVDGIENLQVLYGVDTNGDRTADQYQNAAALGGFVGVVSVRVALLANSLDEVSKTLDTNAYELLDAPAVGPFSDGRRRQVYTSTILIRN